MSNREAMLEKLTDLDDSTRLPSPAEARSRSTGTMSAAS